MAIKNLNKAANRILKAIANKERIILYGDSDPDGVSSVIILEEAILLLGGNPPKIYFMDRETEGYGINEKALKILRKYAPALFISLDCGITSVKEVDLANKIGFEVIIIDHHKPLSKMPKASIIVDPKQKGDCSKFKDYAASGLTYKLAHLMLTDARVSFDSGRFLELVAISTISDQMPLEDENKHFVEEGLLALKYTRREGLKALFNLVGITDFDVGKIRMEILPALSIWWARRHINPLYKFLTEKSCRKARAMASKFLMEAEERRKRLKEITEEAMARIAFSSESIIFEGDPSWPLIFTGIVASRLCQKYKKPTFIYKRAKRESPGASRTPQGIDVVKAMDECKKYMITYGGHPQAGGFRAKTKNLEKLKACLIDYFQVMQR